jgi:hypothetical protein
MRNYEVVRQSKAAPEMKASSSVQSPPGLAPRAVYFAAAGLAGGGVAVIAKLLSLSSVAGLLWAIAVLVAFVTVTTPLLLGGRRPDNS